MFFCVFCRFFGDPSDKKGLMCDLFYYVLGITLSFFSLHSYDSLFFMSTRFRTCGGHLVYSIVLEKHSLNLQILLDM